MVFSIFILSLIFGFLSGYGIISEFNIENSILRFLIYGSCGVFSFFVIRGASFAFGLIKKDEK